MTLAHALSIRRLATCVIRRTSAAMALSLAVLPAPAQNQLWINQFGTNAVDDPSDAASDAAGGVYVSGATFGSLGGPSAGHQDGWLARYDSAGNRLWVRQFGTTLQDGSGAATPDGAGGVYVGGFTQGSLGGPFVGGEDAWLARYDGSGSQFWIRQLGTSTIDHAYAAEPDTAGGVFVSGFTAGNLGGPSAGSWDPWLARYDGSGNQLWIRQFGTSVIDVAIAAVMDGSGGVYLGGITQGNLGGPSAGSMDVWLAHYDSAGNQTWIRQLGSSAWDVPYATATDGSGGVFVSGSTVGSLGAPNAGGWDSWLARYDSAGNQIWIRQFGTSDGEDSRAAAPDRSGGVYLSGVTTGSLGGPNAGLADVWLMRYDSAGNQLWIQQLGTIADDVAQTAEFDGSGGVFVSGYSKGNLSAPNAGSADIWLARYDGSCSAGTTYCTASTSSIPGCVAAISGTGSPSLANPSGLTISSGSVPGGNLGICFLGNNGAASIPFGTLGGFVCAQPPVYRSTAKPSGGSQGTCNGNYSFTLQDLINASPIVVVGAAINAEIWARDPANPDGFLLSNGLSFTVCP